MKKIVSFEKDSFIYCSKEINSEKLSYYTFSDTVLNKGYYRLHIKVKSYSPVFDSRTIFYKNNKKIAGFITHQPNNYWTKSLIFVKNNADAIQFHPVITGSENEVYAFELVQLNVSDLVSIIYTRFFWDLSLLNFFKKVLFVISFVLFFKYSKVYNLLQSQRKSRLMNSYRDWIRKNETKLCIKYRKKLINDYRAFKYKPLISVVMPVYNTNPRFLNKAVKSVYRQLYPNWELCICDDCSTNKRIKPLLKKWKNKDKRIKIIYNKKNEHISIASNNALKLANGEYLALMDHDDELRPNSLFEVVKALNENRDLIFIYTDQDIIDKYGVRSSPLFKPQWNPDLFYSQNYLNHLTVLKTERVKEIGGWRAGYEGAQDFDLYYRYLHGVDSMLIRHIPKVLYHWRAVKNSTAFDISEKQYAVEAGLNVAEDYFSRIDSAIKVEPHQKMNHHRIVWPVPNPKPLVSIIIPTRDMIDVLDNCIRSIISKTRYGNYEIIIVNNRSAKSESFKYFDKLIKSYSNISVIDYNYEFNYSSINNYAVKYTKGSILGFINNDIEIITAGWLKEMVSHAVRKDIACVGAKLFYPDNTVQHAGIILGLGGFAAHSHRGYKRGSSGYYGRLQLCQNISAVTGALMFVEKYKFMSVDGFDSEFKVCYNDIDICLKLIEKGYRNLFTPFVKAFHYESKTRGDETTATERERFNREKELLYTKWKRYIENDPNYSINLTRSKEDFSLVL